MDCISGFDQETKMIKIFLCNYYIKEQIRILSYTEIVGTVGRRLIRSIVIGNVWVVVGEVVGLGVVVVGGCVVGG